MDLARDLPRSGSTGATESIERELTLLVRQAHKVHEHLEDSGQPLERPAYAILGVLHDEGPSRLGTVAARFHLDASTVSRQVSTLERQGLLVREVDPGDRRACRLGLTPEGERALARTRAARRQLLHDLLSTWSAQDRSVFASLLQQLNADLDGRLDPRNGPSRRPAVRVPDGRPDQPAPSLHRRTRPTPGGTP